MSFRVLFWAALLICLTVLVDKAAAQKAARKGSRSVAVQNTDAAEDTTAAAKAELAKKNYSAAEAIYRKALMKEPGSARLLTDLGIVLQFEGRSSEAIHAFQQALKKQGLPLTYALLAEERCKTRDADGSRPMLDTIIRQRPLDARALSLVAPCYLDLHEPIEAVEAYSVLLKAPSFPEDLATIQMTKAYIMAAQFFVSKLKAAPDGGPYLAAIESARDTQSDEARSAFDRATAASSYFAPSATFSQAVDLWKAHPRDTALLYLLSTLSGEESMRYVRLCNERYPDSPYLQEFLAEVLADQGRIDEAVASYEALLQKNPELPDLRYKLGMMYTNQQDWARAIAVFQKELELNPLDERAAARISEAMLALEQYTELERFLQPRVTTQQVPLWAHLDLATVEQKLGKPLLAIAQLAAAERDHPTQKNIHYRLMRLYASVGDTAAATREGALFKSTGQ